MRSISDMILEGMWQGDLNDLMLPLVSVDEYASKVDDEAVVIGYYVHDIDAANDLNRFLQKSASNILDAEVSPAPDQKGYYIVFVELLRNAKAAQTIFDITNEITSLTNIGTWKMSVFGTDGEEPVTIEALEKALKIANKESSIRDKKDTLKRADEIRKMIADMRAKVKAAMTLLRASSVSDMAESHGRLVMDDGRETHSYEVVGVGDYALLGEMSLDKKAISVDSDALRACRSMSMCLGEGWDATVIDDCIIVQRIDESEIIILREI